MHILSPETDNCPSWISGRERMTVEKNQCIYKMWSKSIPLFSSYWTERNEILMSNKSHYSAELMTFLPFTIPNLSSTISMPLKHSKKQFQENSLILEAHGPQCSPEWSSVKANKFKLFCKVSSLPYFFFFHNFWLPWQPIKFNCLSKTSQRTTQGILL